MLEKIVSVDLIEIVENNSIQVRKKIAVKEDGVEISSYLHRHVIMPGNDYSQEDPKVQSICALIHTPEVIANFKEVQNANITPTA